MSQTVHEDLERANNTDSDQTLSTQNKPMQPSGGAPSFGDSSGSLFSIYSKAAEEEDNKMVERWQKDADGILIFMGLFSAAVAALLAVTVQDLRPNIQDTSAFYLANIYQVLADPNLNATLTSLPPPVLQPPPFSPPRYAVWVNSLWFLSLVMGLSCALLATSLHQWARRYIRLTQPARVSPEKRARMRAFFADGLDKMHVPWAVEAIPTLLHLSLFLFFAGLAIFLFHVDHEVFISVVWWIGLFSMVYVSITLLPLIRHDSPYYAPLSTPAWFLYAGTLYVTFKVLYHITTAWYFSRHFAFVRTRIKEPVTRACMRLGKSRDWMTGGVEKAAEGTASERSSEIDTQIFDWTTSALGDDISLEKFFEAIPGFVNSNLVYNFREHLSQNLLGRLSVVVLGLMDRTWSSNLVSDSEKLRRLDIATNAMRLIRVDDVSSILRRILNEHWDSVPQSIEMGHTLARWCTGDDLTAMYARSIVGEILASARERDDKWVALAAHVCGLAEHDLRDDIAGASAGDNALLVILIQVTRPYNRSCDIIWFVLETLCKLDISKTLPRLQHDFCTLWNEISQRASRPEALLDIGMPLLILQYLRPLYTALHQGTDACPAAFSESKYCFSGATLFQPYPFPLCNIAGHHPDSTAHVPDPNSAVSLPIQSGNSPDVSSRSPSPPHSKTTREKGEASQDLFPSAIQHTSPIPINSGPPLTFSFPPAAADVRNDSSQDQNQTIPMEEVFHLETQSLRLMPSPPDTASNSFEHEGN